MRRSRPDGSPGLGLDSRLMSPPPGPAPGNTGHGTAAPAPTDRLAPNHQEHPGGVRSRRSGGSHCLDVSAMQTTILPDRADESTPATSVRVAVIPLVSSADAEQVLDGQPLHPGEAVALGAGAFEV